jgi:clostripain
MKKMFSLSRNMLSFLFLFAALISAACGGGGGGSDDGGGNPPDKTAPVIVSTNPVSGAVNVPSNTAITVTFDENILESSVSSDCIVVSGDSGDLSGSAALSADKKTITFTPSTDMDFDTSYTVEIEADISDLAGNEITSETFSFTTGSAPDNTPPSVTVKPVDNASGISVGADIILTFSEAMMKSTINSTNIKLLKNGVEVPSAITYYPGTFVAEIDPSSDLDFLQSYTVSVSTGISDMAGNHTVSNFSSVFKTAADTTPLTLSSHVPVSNAVNVAKGSNITATFSKRIDPATVNSSNIYIVKTSDGSSVSAELTYDDSTKTITIDPLSDLEAESTQYTVTVSTGIKGISGNLLSSSVSWNFKTTDTTGPTVSSTSPADMATGVSVSNGFSITFSEPINATTITSANIGIKDSSNNSVAGTFTYDSSTMTATWKPSYNLNYQTDYTVSIGTGIKDASGNSMNSASSFSFTTKERCWTIMYYGDADCNLESAIMNDIAEMKSGYVDDQGLDLVTLVDRHPYSKTDDGYTADSTTLGANFTDTRLFRITNGKAERIGGSSQMPSITTTSTSYEANMGDAETLKSFIKFCKANYPAKNYALIMSNHGGGAKSAAKYKSFKENSKSKKTKSKITKEICYDETSSDDFLHTAEISDVLTSSESVNLFGLDACLMSSIEFAYQFRDHSSNAGFKASIMVASAPLEWDAGWAYNKILPRLKSGGGNNGESDIIVGGDELNYDPAALTASQLGGVIVEEQYDSTWADTSQSLTCIDMSKVYAVKTGMDALAVKLAADSSSKSKLDTLRRVDYTAKLLHYFDDTYLEEVPGAYAGYTDWLYYPFFDIYNLSAAIFLSSSFTSDLKLTAGSLNTAVSKMVLYSFGNSDFEDFVSDASGVHVFYPNGDDFFFVDSDGNGSFDDGGPHWFFQYWYNAIDLSSMGAGASLGKLSWCIDGRNTAVNKVGNWFELLDSWYDLSNGTDGGMNYYQW